MHGRRRQIMTRLLIPSILVLLLVGHPAISAQLARPPRVCVMGSDTSFWPAVRTNSTPNARQARDLVVKYLKKLSAKGPEKLDALALTSTNSDDVWSEINKVDCSFTAVVAVDHLRVGKPDYPDQPPVPPSTTIEPSPMQTPPISFYVMRRVSEHLSVSLGGYYPSTWSEGIAAEEIYKAILKNPVP